MLQKKYRLKKYSAFMATYKLNNVVANKYLCVYYGRAKTDKSFPTKFAFVVSKKISKRAVKRNRIKRLMRESVRLLLKEAKINHINKYMSVIVVAKGAALEADYSIIRTSLTDLLSSNA